MTRLRWRKEPPSNLSMRIIPPMTTSHQTHNLEKVTFHPRPATIFYPSDVIVFLLHISWGTGNQPCAQKHPSSKTIKKHRFLRQCSSKQYKIVFGKWRSLRAMPFDLLILINLVVLFFYNFSLLSSPQTSRYCHQLVKSLPHVQYILFIRPQS